MAGAVRFACRRPASLICCSRDRICFWFDSKTRRLDASCSAWQRTSKFQRASCAPLRPGGGRLFAVERPGNVPGGGLPIGRR
jgi:hypothetical protein